MSVPSSPLHFVTLNFILYIIRILHRGESGYNSIVLMSLLVFFKTETGRVMGLFEIKR